MATTTFEVNTGSTGTPTWTDLAANILHFSGSLTSISATIATTDWNDGTHYSASDGGSDACAGGPNTNHPNNTKFLTTGTLSINGGGSEAINDTNLTQGECSLRLHLTNGTSVATQNSFFYCFNGSVTTTEATEIESYAFERGVSATAWVEINNDSTNVGGNNSGERLDIGEKSAATDHTWYLAVSARGETAGAKTAFDYGFATEIF